MRSWAVRGLCFTLAMLPAIAGCRGAGTKASPTAVANGQERTFPVRGQVVSVSGTTVELNHETIPGFMAAMTMPYQVADASVASELHPGDRLVAKILVRQEADGFHDARLDDVVVTAQARPDYKPAVQYHVPTTGDVVPNFRLRNQNGREITLSGFRGKLLLMTFIYTRCNFADFCPRMSRNFAEIDKALAKDPGLYAQTHLLSVSFDPAYDTPAVLRSYGGAYTGRYTQETFAHWDFAAPPEKDLMAMEQFFNVGVTAGKDGPATHSLSTVLVGKDGKVIAWYPTNDWKPADVVARIRQAAAATT